MIYVLDRSAVTDLVRENPKYDARLGALGPNDEVVTCAIVRGEALFGVERLPHGKRRDELRQKVEAVLSSFACRDITETAADHYAQIRRGSQAKGTSLDANDLWIAATTLLLGATLVTRDSDFRNIDGLWLEDWSI